MSATLPPPPIPVENLYHLLTYAWDERDTFDPADLPADADGATALPDFLASLLLNVTARLLQRGLLHHYEPEPAHETPRPRGKLLVADTLRTHALTRGRVWCAPDEWTADTLPNQLLCSTLHYLHHHCTLRPALHTRLAYLLPRLPAGRRLPVSAAGTGIFNRVRLHRHSAHYRHPLSVCRLIWTLRQATESAADQWLLTLLERRKMMARLFERFVRNFCAHHYPAYRTAANELGWGFALPQPGSAEAAHLPGMKTDVLVRWPGPAGRARLLIECKYYPDALAPAFHGGRKLHTKHLYQLSAYYQHLGQYAPPADAPFDALLLYPRVGYDLPLTYAVPDSHHRFRVATLNLNQDWAAVEAELHTLLALN